MSDKHGNVHVTAPAVPCPFHPNDPFHKERASASPCTVDPNNPYTPFIEGREKLRKSIEKRERDYPKRLAKCITIGLSDARKENPSSDAPPHSLPPVHLSESNDSKVQEELGFDESKRSLSSESKDTVDNNAGLNTGHLPPSESKSDSETELTFKFPPTEGTSTEGTSMHSPLYSPGLLQSSSSEETTLDVKQEPLEGQRNSNYDPNDKFDLRNTLLAEQDDNYFLSSSASSASDNKPSPTERSVITRQDVEIIRSQASAWQSENDALMAMIHLISKDSRPNLIIDKKALASILFQSRPPSDALEELAKAQAESFKVGKRDFETRMSKLTAEESRKIHAPRWEVERMKAEYEDKWKDLNLRIQASIALDDTAQISTKQLDEALDEVKQLKEQNQRLQKLLKVVRDGDTVSVQESKAKVSTRDNESSTSIVSNSSSSMSPFVTAKDTKKRDLSPEYKTHSDSSSFKKLHPKPKFSTAWQNWNRDGSLTAKDYGHGPVLRVLQGKSIIELDAILAKVSLAATDFRSLFPADNAPEIGLRHRNAEHHSDFSICKPSS